MTAGCAWFGVFKGGPWGLRPGFWMACSRRSWLVVYFGYPGTSVVLMPRPQPDDDHDDAEPVTDEFDEASPEWSDQ